MDDVAAIRGEFDPEDRAFKSRPLTSLSYPARGPRIKRPLGARMTANPESEKSKGDYRHRGATESDAVPMEQLSTPLPNSPVAMDDLMTSEADDGYG